MRRITTVLLLTALGACDNEESVPAEPEIVEVDEAELEELLASQEAQPLDDTERETTVDLVREVGALDPEDPDDATRLAELADELGGQTRQGSDELTLDRDPMANLSCMIGYALSENTKNLAATMLGHASDAYDQSPRLASACVTDAMSTTSAALNTFLYASQANSSWYMRHLAVIEGNKTVERAQDAAASCNGAFWWTGSNHAYNAWQTANDTHEAAELALVYLNSCIPG